MPKLTVTIESPNWNNRLPIFFAPQFLAGQSDDYGWLVARQNNRRVACLPFFIHRQAGFRLVRFAHHTWHDQDPKETDEVQFLNQGVETLKPHADSIIQPMTQCVFQAAPAGALVAPFGSYWINLRPNEQILWKNLHAKHRNIIRRAYKQQVTFACNKEPLSVIHHLFHHTMARSQKSFMSYRNFCQQVNQLDNFARIYTVYSAQGQLQGAALVVFNQQLAHCLHAGSVTQPVSGALNFMHWQIMCHLRQQNIQWYELVGGRVDPDPNSRLATIQRFKRNFGSQFCTGYLWKYPLKPFKSWAFHQLYRLLRNRQGDIIDQEQRRLQSISCQQIPD